MKHIQAPNKYKVTKGYKVFLAGSIEMDKAEKWQDYVVSQLGDCSNSLVLLNPRRDDWDSSWEQKKTNKKFSEQVKWELNAMQDAELVVFYFAPETVSPISLMELGYMVSDNIVVCCPEGFQRKGNVDIFCEVNGIHMVDSLDDLIAYVREETKYIK